jgi:uncharacterized coiled-coil DUF342 family protein
LKKFIHQKWNTSELVPKGMKELKKALETGSGGHKEEAKCIKELAFLKESMTYIEQKESIDAQLNEMTASKKALQKDLPSIIKEIKNLQE